MKKNRCLPVGNLPYTTDKAATKMMVKLFENNPYLAILPEASENDTLLNRTIVNIPGLYFKDKKILFRNDKESIKAKISELDSAFSKPSEENIESFGIDSYFLEKYYQILARIKPAETVINMLGPFSLLQQIQNIDGMPAILNKNCRKVIIEALCVKSMWIISKIMRLSPDTKPIIILEEPLLFKAGDLKREYEEINQEFIVNLFSKVITKIQEFDAEVCIQCFEKCDWQIPIEAGANMISFDAYNNPNNLNIIPEKVNEYLARGGKINWAIIPVMNENVIKSMTIDLIYDRFIKTMEGLIVSGTSERLTYNRATVSVQGNINSLPIIFAEKALMLANQLAKRIPIKN